MNFNDFLNLKNEPQTPPPSGKKSLRDILGQSQATHQPPQNEAAQAAANYLNGKVTPQQAEQFTQNDQGLGGFFDPVIKAGGYVTDKITGAMDSAADYLNSKIYNEKEQKDIKVTEGIAKIDNRYGLTPRVQNLINGNGFELDKAQKDEIEAAKIKYLNDNGYNTYFKTLDNGNRELMVEMSDGRIVPADAGVLNSLWAAKGEILGSVFGGVKGAKAGADLLKALGGGKKAATAGAVAGGAALGGAGAVTGAYGDLSKLQQENLIDLSDDELLKEAKLRGVEDVAASLVGAAAIPPILKAISVGAKGSFNLGGKAIDIMPILSQLRKQNIDGALKSAEAQVGGKEAFNAIIAEQNAKGMGLEIASGTKSAQSARAAMGEAKTAADALKNERLNTAANSALNTGQKAIDWVENVLFDNAAMTEGQAKILQAARANPRIAQVLQEQIMRDPQAANGIMQIINRDADGLITKIGGAIDEGFSLKKEFGTYEAGVKRDFGSAVDEIANQYDGVVTALKADDPANAEFINQINGVLNGMWGEKLTPNLSRILSDLSDGRAISVKDINTLRAELNAVIDKSTDGTQRYTAGLIKDFVDTKLMGDILNQRPDLAPKARELYSNALKEYAQMSQIKESGWGRNVGKIDVGENTIYTQMGRVLDEQVDGNSVDMFLSKISPQNAEQVEMRLINGVIESMTRQIDGGRVVDYEKVAAALSKRKFTSKAAADTIALISDLSRLIGQDSKIAQAASRYQNPLKMSQGISQNPAVRFLTMGANRTTNLLLRLLPIVGRDPAMAHHLSVAARNASDYNGFIAEISKMAKDNNFKPALRAAIAKFVREADNGNTRPPNGGGTPPSGGAPTTPPTTPRTPTNKETLQDKRLKSPSGEGNASKAFDSGTAKSTAPKDDILNLKKDLERKRAAIKAEPTAEQAKADKLKLQLNAIDEAMETARKKGKLTEQMTQKMEAKKVQITKEINRLIGDIEQNIFIKWHDPFTEMRDRIRWAKEDAMASQKKTATKNARTNQKKTATKNAHANQAARADEISGYNEAMSDLADDFTPPTPPTPKSGSINGAAQKIGKMDDLTKDTPISNHEKTASNVRNKYKNAKVIYDAGLRSSHTPPATSTATIADEIVAKQPLNSAEKTTKNKPVDSVEVNVTDRDGNILKTIIYNKDDNLREYYFFKKYYTSTKPEENYFKSIKYEINQNKNTKYGYIESARWYHFRGITSDAEILKRIDNGIGTKSQKAKDKIKTIEMFKKDRADAEKHLDINPIKAFGTNFAEFYRDGKGAVAKVIAEKQGQVAGAFYRKDLGDIDLVWGDDTMGLKKILTKHGGDFKAFSGENVVERMQNGLSEIVENGKVVSKNGVDTIWYKLGDEYFLVGLSKGFKGEGDNKWVITSYKKTVGKIPQDI